MNVASITKSRAVGPALFALALACRLLYWSSPALQFKAKPSDLVLAGISQPSDSVRYLSLSRSLVEGCGYRYECGEDFTMFDPPAYPMLLACLLKFSPNFQLVFLVQCLLDALNVLLLFGLSKILFRQSLPGLLAGLAYALYYPNFLYTVWLLTETLFTVLLTLFLLLFTLATIRRRRWLFCLTGCVFGILCLTRPTPVYFLPILLVLPIIKERRMTAVLQAGCLLAGFLVVQAPWLAQGPRHYGRWVVGSTGGGQVMLGGVALEYDGDQDTQVHTNSPFQAVRMSALPKDEQDRVAKQMACEEFLRNLRKTPGRALGLMMRQVSRLYLNVPFKRPQSWNSYAVAGLNAIILLTGMVGLVLGRRNRGVLFIGLFIAYFTALHSVTCAVIRFSAPLMPAWLLLASLPVSRALQRDEIEF